MFEKMRYSTILYGLASGAVDRGEALESYRRQYKSLLQRIRRVQASDVPFVRKGDIPTAPKPGSLRGASLEDIAHAYHELNVGYAATSKTKRREMRAASIAGMRAAGWAVDERNIDTVSDFFAWFRENHVGQMLDSKEVMIKEFLRERSGKRTPASRNGWARVFVKWLWDNGYDEAAQGVGSMFFASYQKYTR